MKIKEILNLKNKNKSTLIGGIVLFMVVGLLAVVMSKNFSAFNSNSKKKDTPYIVPALTKVYTNSQYGFSLNMPDDFVVREMNIGDTLTIIFENSTANGDGGEKREQGGIQMQISKFSDADIKTIQGVKTLDADFIKANIPDMRIENDQSVEIGSGYKGVAFTSDNEEFDGDSREVWFVFRNNLYQISTYSRFDTLLQDMFATWKFN